MNYIEATDQHILLHRLDLLNRYVQISSMIYDNVFFKDLHRQVVRGLPIFLKSFIKSPRYPSKNW